MNLRVGTRSTASVGSAVNKSDAVERVPTQFVESLDANLGAHWDREHRSRRGNEAGFVRWEIFRLVTSAATSRFMERASAFLAGALLFGSIIADAAQRFDSAKLAQMDAEVNRAIAEHRLPGGVLWLECKGSNYHKAFGLRAITPNPEVMTEDTMFDTASMTKVLATTPALMILYERGQLKLDEPIATYLPEFSRGSKEPITVRHLLTHTSGFKRTLSRSPDWSDMRKAMEAVGAEKPSSAPGTSFLYSDINFIILGELVHRVSGRKLNDFAAQEIYGPLKMRDTCFLPGPAKRPRIAPTEKTGRDVLRGRVHDPKAQQMGGVAGHAGVFTTAADVARFSRMMLNGGELNGVRILKPETVKLMTTVQTPKSIEARRGFGWDIDSEFSRPRGELFPIGSYGHTGFTGVCLWIDPFSETFWMFLSNRVHPDGSGNIYALQKKLATLAAEAVLDFDFRAVPEALTPRPTNRAPEP